MTEQGESQTKIQNLRQLHRLLVDGFNLDELKTLCFDLGVDFDSLDGANNSAKARELIIWHYRRNKLDLLLQQLKSSRPSIAWPPANILPTKIDAEQITWEEDNFFRGCLLQIGRYKLVLYLLIPILILSGLIILFSDFFPSNNIALLTATSPNLTDSTPTFQTTASNVPSTSTKANDATPIESGGDAAYDTPQATREVEEPTTTPVPTASSTTVAANCGPPVGWVQYIVQSGDTLFRLATATHTTIAALQQANCLGEETLIFAGSPIWLPRLPEPITSEQPTPTLIPDNPLLTTETPSPMPTPTPTPTALFLPATATTTSTLPTATFTPIPPSPTPFCADPSLTIVSPLGTADQIETVQVSVVGTIAVPCVVAVIVRDPSNSCWPYTNPILGNPLTFNNVQVGNESDAGQTFELIAILTDIQLPSSPVSCDIGQIKHSIIVTRN